MYKFERLEFPAKYPIPKGIMLSVFIFIIIGISIHNCSQKQLAEEIQITEIAITDYSRFHIEVQYTLRNTSGMQRDVWLLLKAYSNKGEELGSSLFLVKAQPDRIQSMIKIMDKLNRPLDKDEIPYSATINVYTRKVI